MLGEREHVLGQVATGQDAGVDRRVQGLDPAVQHLRRTGHLADLADRDPGVGDGPGRPPGRDQLHPRVVERPGEVHQTRLVTDAEEGSHGEDSA